MERQKRDCPIKAVIEPLGAELLAVTFDFGERKLEYTPSTVMGDQFGEFVCALYTLYHEKNNERYDGHSEWNAREYHANSNHEIQATTVNVDWDGEGPCMLLEMTKEWEGNTITLRISTDCQKTYTEYVINDRDFCHGHFLCISNTYSPRDSLDFTVTALS